MKSHCPSILSRLPDIALALLPRINFDKEIRTRHVAFLLNKSKILRIGWNGYKTHPEMIRRGYPPFCRGLHAECHVLLYSKVASYRGLSLAVLRVNWNNQIDLSMPCPSCRRLLLGTGLKDVWFTDSKGVWTNLMPVKA